MAKQVIDAGATGELTEHHADRDAKGTDARHASHALRIDRGPLKRYGDILWRTTAGMSDDGGSLPGWGVTGSAKKSPIEKAAVDGIS